MRMGGAYLHFELRVVAHALVTREQRAHRQHPACRLLVLVSPTGQLKCARNA